MTVITGVPFGTFPVRINFESENVEKSGKKQISQVKIPSDSKDICGYKSYVRATIQKV
jgi:hypothetical protein